MLTEEEVRAACPKAEHIIYTVGTMFVGVGMRVGLFSRAISLTPSQPKEEQRRAVRDLYMDLVMMNRRQDEQERQAREEAQRAARG